MNDSSITRAQAHSANQVTTKPAAPPTARQMLESEGFKAEMAKVLHKNIPPDRLLRSLFTEMQKIPKLADCSKQSLMAGVMIAAQLNLEIGAAQGLCYLIPYGDKATFILGYKGEIQLLYRSGMCERVQAHAVYEADDFVHVEGLNPRLEHRPARTGDRGRLVAAYCVIKLKGCEPMFRVVYGDHIEAVKKASRSSSAADSPWNKWPAQMWCKTAVRSIMPFIPQSPEDHSLFDVVREAETGDYAEAIEGPRIRASDALLAAPNEGEGATEVQSETAAGVPTLDALRVSYDRACGVNAEFADEIVGANLDTIPAANRAGMIARLDALVR